jgi:hypothetical protein
MAITFLGQALGVALTLGSGALALYALAGGLFWQLVIRPSKKPT